MSDIEVNHNWLIPVDLDTYELNMISKFNDIIFDHVLGSQAIKDEMKSIRFYDNIKTENNCILVTNAIRKYNARISLVEYTENKQY